MFLDDLEEGSVVKSLESREILEVLGDLVDLGLCCHKRSQGELL